MARWRERVDTLAGLAHLVKITTRICTCSTGPASMSGMRGALARSGPRLVVVTRGAKGQRLECARPGGCRGADGHHGDTVGAGDTFQAAMLAHLAEGDRLAPAALAALDGDALARLLDFAARGAAITCSRRGADMPRRSEIADV